VAAAATHGPVPERFVALAHELAEAAAAVQRRHFRTPVAVDTKADQSPVTIADREAEAAMRRLLAAEVPEHGILGEEAGGRGLDAEWLWVLDPIDGTRAFIAGRPWFGTLIALLHQGQPVLGVIDHAILGERWVGRAGAATTHNGRPVRTRSCARLGDAVLTATSPLMFSAGSERAAFDRLAAAVRLPLFGGDCYGFGLLASGFADLVCESHLEPYDYLAVVPVIEGAGGRITDWAGAALERRGDVRVLVAGDARVHAAALEVLAGN
jgi:inositol-phosphate phosphatase/L-galactose 1-phosphate phosphatase/histidinol-phosphatase